MTTERTEVQECYRWASDLLNANTSLVELIPRIYAEHVQRVPNGSSQFPYILGSYLGGIDVPGLGVRREQTHADFQWKIVTEGAPTANDRQAGVYMDHSLQTAVAQLSHGWYITCRRLQEISRAEYDVVKTLRYANTGGIYRCWIYAA